MPTAARTVTRLRPERSISSRSLGSRPPARQPLLDDLRLQRFRKLRARGHAVAPYPQVGVAKVQRPAGHKTY